MVVFVELIELFYGFLILLGTRDFFEVGLEEILEKSIDLLSSDGKRM